MFGLSDPAPIEFPEQKRESLLNFLQGDNDKETRLKVDSAFSKATLYNIEGVFVLDWENGLTEEYTCKNNIWVRIGINNNLYKMKIEQIKKDNQKEAPFYQGMTKEETIESICKDVYASPKGVIKIDVYRFGHVVVSVSKWKHGYQLELIRNEESNKWQVIGKATPYYKELIQESQAEKKELEGKAVFYQNMTKTEVVESLVRCIYGGEIPAEYFLTKNKVFVHEDIVVIEGLIEGKNKGYQQFCKYNKDGKFWTVEDPNNPKELAPLASEEHQHQKHLMEKEAQRKKEEAEMKTKAQFHQDGSPEKFGKIGGVVHFGNCKPYFAELIIKEVTEQIQQECNEHQKRVDKLLDDYTKKVSGKFDLEAESINDGILAMAVHKENEEQKQSMKREAEKQKDLYLKRLAVAECHPNQLTAQDLIQAAKDELVYRIYGGCCSSVHAKQGFAECINFLEQTLKK